MTSAILDWFAILFTGHPIGGLQPFKRLYLGWRARVLAYGCFLRDEYPPFGDGPYPATLDLPDEPATREPWTVGLRLFLLVPHLIVVFALMIAALFVWLVSWVWVVATGRLARQPVALQPRRDGLRAPRRGVRAADPRPLPVVRRVLAGNRRGGAAAPSAPQRELAVVELRLHARRLSGSASLAL